MLRKLQNKQGFTLIELLIVIVILGILIVIVISATSGSKSKANNDQRNADLSRIQTALEDCYSDNGNKYPSPDMAAVKANTCVAGKFQSQTVNGQAIGFPQDPKAKTDYSYSSTDGSSYTLSANDDNGNPLTTLNSKQ